VERMARRRRRCDDMSLLLSNAGRWIEEERLPSWTLQNAPARDPSGGLKHNVAGHSGSKLHRLHCLHDCLHDCLHGLHRVHLSNSPAPPQLSCRYAPPPLRPCAPTPPSTQSSTSSGGFDVPPASSQASLKRVFHASPGAAHVWARWKLPHSGPENSRELHGMLPRSTRDKAGARRTRHCSEWRGEGSGEQWMVRVKEERKMCHSTRARHQGQQRDHPQSPELQPCTGHKVLTQHQR
jgi:hypothetical protein